MARNIPKITPSFAVWTAAYNQRKASRGEYFDKRSKDFASFRRIQDSEHHQLHVKGVGAAIKYYEVLSLEDEDQLWRSGTIGLHSPITLLTAVFIYNGKNFYLRGRKE